MSNKNNKKSSVNQVKQQVKANDEKQVSSSLTAKRKIVLNSPEDYAPSSQIAKAYGAGCFPNFTHQKLFHALAQALDGKDEGSVDFNKVLEGKSAYAVSKELGFSKNTVKKYVDPKNTYKHGINSETDIIVK